MTNNNVAIGGLGAFIGMALMGLVALVILVFLCLCAFVSAMPVWWF